MFSKKMMATTVFAIAATGITMATAHGEAGLADVTVNGVDGSVGYTTTLAADHSNALITLASGHFVLAPDAVQVVGDDGALVGSIPMTLTSDTGQALSVTPVLNSDTSLTLTPVGGPTVAATTSQDLPFMHQAGFDVAAGVFFGAVVGCVIGIIIGIWFFLVGALVGCAIGAVIGAFVGAALAS
ncbi:hypothetical protein [Nocardia seriolae]|uniref:DUF8020 domain-containing protein n=1 Tax=Nocardia seriolae TaxID=37332 RepID=A0ABC9YU89_9NOCA|nr:hypothetical protein [Nocardia seriolae]APA97026.1 hypothetical protein NS506_02968 [Nocardia seriolae]OJF81895.1 hypothetical protein NS14008_25415 [Nocardia seriolae]WKY54387.1 hypothetical protein Q5P07_10290 [Nocardia seriolae]WNJ61235.1 hypothetical protein RMO66_11375 [Nocardia seriolae]BAW08783.1 conserved hypothetical protein [Nocardia seriolae]